MDMQPLQAPPDGGEWRKNQPIVSKGTRQKAMSIQNDQYPPLLMMSSLSGETDSVVGESASPSKRLLEENHPKQLKTNGNRTKRQSKTKTPSSSSTSSSRGSGGMSSKITRALFRDRRVSHGSFTKMDSMASDEHGSHFKRSARSPFHAVEPRSTDFGTVATVPFDEAPVPSFDNASTNSGLTRESPTPSPPTVTNKRHEQHAVVVRTKSPSQPPKKPTSPIFVAEEQTNHLSAGNNVSALSIGSELSSRRAPAAPQAQPVRSLAMPARNFEPQPTRSVTMTAAANVEAQPIRSFTMAAGNSTSAPVRPPSSTTSSVSSLNYSESLASSSTIHNCANSLVGVKLAPTKSEDTSAPPSEVAEKPIASDDVSFGDLIQDRLKERLEEIESPAETSVCTAASKKIPSIRPPPPLPPKAPRKRIESPTNLSCHSAPSSSLKQHEERLLRGGDFLNESSDSAPEGGPDLPLKLLQRLEAAQNDANLMAHHHSQDPPLAMATVASFGSSTITSRHATSARRRSYSSSKEDSSSNNPYAALASDRSRAGDVSTTSVHLVEEEEEDVILSPAADQSHDEATKLCYLYSQDKEFENSILSPQNSSPPLLPSSPTKTLYRSDAIDTFMEQTGCSTNEKFIGALREMGYDTKPRDTPVSEVDTEDHVVEDEDRNSIVSDEFLNMVTSGCTGMQNPAAKEAMKEKLVALEAGWSGFRTQFNEKVQTLEESWQSWNLNSLMQFNSPCKGESAAAREEPNPVAETVRNTAPVEMGTTTVLTTPPMRQSSPPKVDESLPQVELELVQADDSILIKSPTSEDEVVLGVVRELARSKAALAAAAKAERLEGVEGDVVEKILMGSTEQDVPLSLKNTLADISMIADGNNQSGSANSGGRSVSPDRPKPFLDCSREDSEGGKVILDAAEWDPVYSSDTGDDETEAEPVEHAPEAPVQCDQVQAQPQASPPQKSKGFVLFRAKNWGKKKANAGSPKSVLVEI